MQADSCVFVLLLSSFILIPSHKDGNMFSLAPLHKYSTKKKLNIFPSNFDITI